MAKPFDAASKSLIRRRPADVLALAGLPVPADPALVTMHDGELSIATRAADKLIQVNGTPGGPYLAVVEFQANRDDRLDDRSALYNSLARWLYAMPVRNVVYLLCRDARSRFVTGRVDGPGLTFAYDIIPVWTLPVGDLLAGPIGTVPLAPLVDQPADQLPVTLDKVWQRLKNEVAPDRLADVVTQTAVLTGLRYDEAIAERLMQSVLEMEQSSVYQAIMRQGFERGRGEAADEAREEGLEEGRRQAERDLLFKLATTRFGPPSAEQRQRVATMTVSDLNQSTDRLLSAKDWSELVGP